MPRVIQHAHKLKRHVYKTTGNAVFFCVLPDCGFKTEVQFLLGKKAVCWICGKEFTMNEYSLRLARPRCMSCVKHKKDVPDIRPAGPAPITAETISTEDVADRLRRNLASVGVVSKSNEEDI